MKRCNKKNCLLFTALCCRLAARALVACLVLPAANGCKPRAEQEPIWIGHVAPFSGPNSRIGQHSRQAIVLAVEEANTEENRVAGRRIGVLHVDSHDDPNTLQPEAVRLITINRVVALLGGVDLAQVERLGRAARPYDVPLVTPAALPPDRLSENIFSINASLSFQGTVLARFAATELKAQRILVFREERPVSNSTLAEAFHKEFARLAGQDVQHVLQGEPDHAKTTVDISKIASEWKEPKPQAVLYIGVAANLVTMRAMLQDARITAPLLFAGDGEQVATLQADSKLSNGIFLATPYVREQGTAELEGFVKRYQEHFSEVPSTDALLAYDGIRVLLQAMRRAESTSKSKAVLAELVHLTNERFDSLSGRIGFNKDHSAGRPLFVVRLEKGNMQGTKRYDSETK